MREGVLRKGFTINTLNGFGFRIPKGTVVRFHSSTPRITFDGYSEVVLFRESGTWYASIYGTLFIVVYDRSDPPYPLLYFRKQ
jgi:hypothetical protein